MVENIDEVLNYVSLCKDLNMALDTTPDFKKIDDYNDKELIDNEIKNYGFYLSHHPVTKYDRSGFITLDKYKNYFNKTITTLLYLESIKTIRNKNNEKMSFVKLSDEYDTIEGVIFSKELNNIGDIEKNNIYRINGKVERRNNTYQIIIYNMVKY